MTGIMTREYAKLITELAELTETIKSMNERKKAIEAELLIQGADDLKDTKEKSVAYSDGAGNRLTYTEATSVTVVSPAYLKQLFGEAYPDLIKETAKTEYKIASKALERLFAALYTGDITRLTTEEFFGQLPCDEKQKKALRKKLKGADFEKDRAALAAIGGFDDDSAKDYAYLFADAVVWDQLIGVCRLARMTPTAETIDTVMKGIGVSVAVEETSKLKLERAEHGGD
ncbi:MAG: hypothetical protein NC084_09825 [Bacteroides sp.]|nr:hypothetical protein [Eubacterium sp.]MCM1419417.1 hypothetical protein [Roseburia sp.]MCM1462996.1 hypothetical protein [Bacteroides sp.]